MIWRYNRPRKLECEFRVLRTGSLRLFSLNLCQKFVPCFLLGGTISGSSSPWANNSVLGVFECWALPLPLVERPTFTSQVGIHSTDIGSKILIDQLLSIDGCSIAAVINWRVDRTGYVVLDVLNAVYIAETIGIFHSLSDTQSGLAIQLFLAGKALTNKVGVDIHRHGCYDDRLRQRKANEEGNK